MKKLFHILLTTTAAVLLFTAVAAAASPIDDFVEKFDGTTLSDVWKVNYKPTDVDGKVVDTWFVEEGQLIASASHWNALKTINFYTGDPAASDYSVETTISLGGTDCRDAGLFVRATDIKGSVTEYKGYYVGIVADKREYTDGISNGLYANYPLKITVWRSGGTSGTWSALKTFEVGAGKVFAKNASYKLKVLAYGDTIRVFLDGQFVGEVKDSTYKAGYAGINAYMTLFKVDDFTLRALTAEEIADFGKTLTAPAITPLAPVTPVAPATPETPAAPQVPEETGPESAEKVALRLKELGLFKGVSDTDFALNRAPSRTEALVMLIRLLGKEAEVTKTTAKHPFNDVAAWADQYVAYAYNAKLTNGISATQFGTSNADAAAYLTFVLRALGYSDANGADFTWDAPFELAKKVGILTEDVNTEKFFRADVAIVSKNALTAKLKGTNTTLAEKLISEGVFTKGEYEKVIVGTPPVVKNYLDLSEYPSAVTFSFESLDLLQSNSILKDDKGVTFADGALKIDYTSPKEAYKGQYHVDFELETKNLLVAAQKLAQIVYRTNAKDGELRLYTGGGADEYVVLAYDVARTGGEWTTSSFAELTTDMIVSINTPKTMTIALHTSDKNATLEIKELNLFCSPEQAQRAVAKGNPVVFDFSGVTAATNSGLRVRYKQGDSLFSKVTFEKVKGVGAAKLTYTEHDWGNYHVAFDTANQSSADRFKESDTWYIRVKYLTDADTNAKLTFINNQNGNNITLETDFKTDNGEWRISAPVQLPKGFIERLSKALHVTVAFSFPNEGVNIYVSEVAFFTSITEACDYYGDMKAEDVTAISSNLTSMVMSDTAKTVVYESANTETEGLWERNPENGAVVLKYNQYNKYNWGNYRMVVRFQSVPTGAKTANYIRVVYKAKNPEGQTDPVKLMLVSTGKTSDLTIDYDVKDTGGEWVLSPVQQLYPAVFERISTKVHVTMGFHANKPGGEYEVREILFFDTLEEAANCKLAPETRPLSIAGNSISDYAIVISENESRRVKDAVDAFNIHIRKTIGKSLEVITDAEPKREHEIVIGQTTRAVSQPYYGENGKYVTGEIAREKFYVFVKDGDLVVTGGTLISVEEGLAEIAEVFLTYNTSNFNKDINLEEGLAYLGTATLGEFVGKYDDPAPVANPDVFTDNFEDAKLTDDYWVEDYASDNWKAADGVYTTKATDLTNVRLHVYERDIDYTAKIRFNSVTDKTNAGLLVRYNDAGAYVRIGYAKGQWYLRFSEGVEYNTYTVDTAAVTVNAGEWYTLRVTANKNVVKVYVNGVLTLESQYVTQISPGPMGMFAENADVSFDDVSVTLVSGQGKVIKGVTESTFWNDLNGGEYSSGSALEMSDGTLRFMHHNEQKQYISYDDGKTWTNDYFTDITTSCVNILLLESGKILKIMDETIDGEVYHVSYTTSDDGKTWDRGGVITSHKYNGYSTMTQIMENDKIFQASTGRILVTQCYSGSIPAGEPLAYLNERGIDCINVVWYSDDEGKIWTKSKTESYECTDIKHLCESKVIEAADGALLWITSHNEVGYFVASESKDGGETWGEFYKITDLPCPTSSFGVMRDMYADNDTTFYLTWVYNEPTANVMPRTRLGLAMTTDGRTWKYLGDVYRWENSLANGIGNSSLINHITDPFVTVTKDYVFAGSGVSRRRVYSDGTQTYHNRQHQRVIRFDKSALVPYDEFPQY